MCPQKASFMVTSATNKTRDSNQFNNTKGNNTPRSDKTHNTTSIISHVSNVTPLPTNVALHTGKKHFVSVSVDNFTK